MGNAAEEYHGTSEPDVDPFQPVLTAIETLYGEGHPFVIRFEANMSDPLAQRSFSVWPDHRIPGLSERAAQGLPLSPAAHPAFGTTASGSTLEDMKAQGVKLDGDKPRFDLIDPYAAEELAKVLTGGAVKYAPHNWRKGIVVSRLIAAALRHLYALLRGEDNDPETGLSHAAHAMCNCMFLVWMLKHRRDMDDRWTAPIDFKKAFDEAMKQRGGA